MLTLTVEEHTETANTLRTVAAVDTSNRAMSLSRQKKTEILKQLRGQFECSRKLFNFALVNAGKKEIRVYYTILMKSLLQTKVCQQRPRSSKSVLLQCLPRRRRGSTHSSPSASTKTGTTEGTTVVSKAEALLLTRTTSSNFSVSPRTIPQPAEPSASTVRSQDTTLRIATSLPESSPSPMAKNQHYQFQHKSLFTVPINFVILLSDRNKSS